MVAKDAEIDIVLGGDAPHLKRVMEATRSDTQTHLHIDTPAMAKLMAEVDLAVGAGGTTTWERACLGLPAIVTAIADNQRDNVRALAAAGAALSRAHWRWICCEARMDAVSSLKADPPSAGVHEQGGWRACRRQGCGEIGHHPAPPARDAAGCDGFGLRKHLAVAE